MAGHSRSQNGVASLAQTGHRSGRQCPPKRDARNKSGNDAVLMPLEKLHGALALRRRTPRTFASTATRNAILRITLSQRGEQDDANALS